MQYETIRWSLDTDVAKFVSAYTSSGLSPDGSLTYFLAKYSGLLRAKDLVLTNRVLTAGEGRGWVEEARAPAAKIAAGPTRAFGRARQLLETAESESLEA